MTVLPPSGASYFTLTPSWDSNKAVSFWDRFGTGSILVWSRKSLGLGDQTDFGNYSTSGKFSGFVLSATVRANPNQFQAIEEIIEDQARRLSARLSSYLTLSDRYNLYPLATHDRYSRSVINGTLDTSRTPTVARLAYPVVIAGYSSSPVSNISNDGEPDQSLTIELAEIP